ncbi:signal transduction histidine kinase [Candidatus Magnetoovum chiemensis]|nr:signal transduction histidine kinase [Candidatus Magnetoovum chiemensis]
MEEELWKYRYLLEDIVEKRTQELKKTNAKLQNEITERMKIEEKLKALISEKDLLISEIHHRVKNNLQIISSLLELQSKNVKDEDAKLLFLDSQSRLKTMALIHERLYQSKDITKVDLAKYITSLIDYLYHSYNLYTNNITINSWVDEVYICVDTAIPCGLIINEVVSNSIKHAFSQAVKGEINIKLTKDGKDNFHLEIKDTGIGLPQHIDINSSTTLGLRLVYSLVTHQLNGTLTVDRTKGTCFIVDFKAQSYNKGG